MKQDLNINELDRLIQLKRKDPKEYKKYIEDFEEVGFDIMNVVKSLAKRLENE